jgi:hypothetical protein
MTETDILERWVEAGIELRVTAEETGKTEVATVEKSMGQYYLTNGLDAEEHPDDAWYLPIIKLVWLDEEFFISCDGAFFELDEILP